jgi:dsDNA-specific endonuclease/ATPase MutS2
MANDKMLQIGDKVELINDTLKGVIIKIEKQFVTLQCKEGFTYTYNKNEIIKRGDFETNSLIDNMDNSIDEKEIRLWKNIKSKNKTSLHIEKINSALEVDLHIHHLVDSENGLTNFEMLNIQLNTAKKKLEFAINKKIQRIVFIHGIGTGVLKNELHQMLKEYPVEIFEASYQKYGQGATEVYIFKNG